MNQREMRSALSVGLEAMGGFPSSAPDWVVEGLYERRMNAAKNAATRNTQRPAPRVGAITASKASDEVERMRMSLQAQAIL